MREIVLDTETTGLDPASGDRIVQLASMPIEARGTTNTIRIKDVQ